MQMCAFVGLNCSNWIVMNGMKNVKLCAVCSIGIFQDSILAIFQEILYHEVDRVIY
jgi:hypothetical protein